MPDAALAEPPAFPDLHLKHVACEVCDAPILVFDDVPPARDCSTFCNIWRLNHPGQKRPRVPCAGCFEPIPGEDGDCCSKRCRAAADSASSAVLGPPRHAWVARAACAGLDINIFVVEQGESVSEAREVCARCPVAKECLTHAMSDETFADFGVFGGLTATERRQRKSRRRELAACGTEAARARHRRREETCATCEEAKRANREADEPPPCGTPNAYQRHRNRGEECATCEEAKVANRAAAQKRAAERRAEMRDHDGWCECPAWCCEDCGDESASGRVFSERCKRRMSRARRKQLDQEQAA